jgi:O-antigen ligase
MKPHVSATIADAGSEIGATGTRRSITRRSTEAIFIVLFFAVVVFSAIPMGANRDWAWSPIVVVLGLLAIWQALGLGISDGHVLRPAEWRALAFVILFFLIVIAIGIVQISPFVPSSWDADLYRSAASALGHPVAAIISLNADSSRAILMKIAACGVIFVVARAACRDRRRARILLVLFVTSAAVVTAYGLVMQATNGSCYVFSYNKRTEFTPVGRQFLCALSGTFVNSNSYAAFAGMALVTALGLTFSRSSTRQEELHAMTPREAPATWFTGARATYLAMSLLLLGGLMLSESRAGFAATVLGALLLGVSLLRGRWPSRPALGWALAAAILVGAVFALVTGSAFFHKVAKLPDEGIVGRFRIWQVTIAAIEQSPWLGWGLGSFPDVYSLLQPPDLQIANDKAHSTPLEWLVELGIPGAMCVFVTVLVPLGVCLSGCWRRRTDRYLPAVAFAASIVAVLHSSIDFSLEIPAIGFMVAALLGMGWAQAFRRYE